MNTHTEEKGAVLKWLKWALIVLTIFLAVQAVGAFKGLGALDPAYNSVSVSGEGEAVAVPDLATFSFSISADADTPSGAQNKVTSQMDKILNQLGDLGIDDKDIKTTNYSVNPRYSYPEIACISYPCPPVRQVQDGYTATHSISVKVREAGEAGQALALVGEGGATNISGISFTTDDPDQIVAEARALAIADARAKAEVLAKQLGVRLVRVVNYYDNGSGYPQPAYAEAYGGDNAVRTLSAPTLPTGENTVRVNVTVTYEIR